LDGKQGHAFTALKDAFALDNRFSCPKIKDNFDLMSTLHSLPRVQFFINGNPTRFHLPLRLTTGWYPLAFRSSTFSETQRNYSTGDRELLGIIEALEDWREYLIGTVEPLLSTPIIQTSSFSRNPRNLIVVSPMAHLFSRL